MSSPTKQLAAIMFTDIVGYTALMGKSEEDALQLLEENRKLHKPLIEKYYGRLIKEMGDGNLAIFNSASDAVYCAGAIQEASKRIPNLNLRIGIHIGDIVVKVEDVFGDGVNIASRIEQLAEVGGITISEPVHRNVKNIKGIRTEFIKEEQLKNVEEAVRIYRVSVEEPVSATIQEEPEEIVEQKSSKPTKRFTIPVIVVLLIFIIFLAYTKFFRGGVQSAPNYSSIAVLPFDDLSPERDQGYLSDGIAEEIINVLTRIDGVKVIGRTSSFSFRDGKTDLVTIGEKLGVQTILEGSVRKSGDSIRITCQLIDASDGSHILSKTYKKELANIFALQDDISEDIADLFKVTLTLSQADSPPTTNIEAYEMYLRGRQLLSQGLVGTQQGIEFLEKAISLDPNFVEAYSQLVESYWAMGLYQLADPQECFIHARNDALKAIQIAPDSYLGYLQLSWLDFSIDWDWSEALKNMDKAIELGAPESQEYLAYYDVLLFRKGDEAIKIIKTKLEDDPLSIDLLLDLDRMYLYSGYYDSAILNSASVLQRNPENSSAKRHLAEGYLFNGDYSQSLKLYGELLDKDPTYAPYGYIGALVGLNRKEDAWKALDSLKSKMSPFKLAMSYGHLGELDSAFIYLDSAFFERETNLAFIKADPQKTPLQNDPRFKAFLEKMKFPEK